MLTQTYYCSILTKKNTVLVQLPRYLTHDLLFSRAIGSLFDRTVGVESAALHASRDP